MLHHGEDVEVFVDWMVYDAVRTCKHSIAIFRGQPGGAAVLVHDLALSGGPGSSIRFFQPPDPKVAPTAITNIMGETTWSTAYLLAPRRRSAEKLFTAYDYEFADLDSDGVYELIAWNRRPFDIRCGFAIADVRFYPRGFCPLRIWLSKSVAAPRLAASLWRSGGSLQGPRKGRCALGCEYPDRGWLCRSRQRWNCRTDCSSGPLSRRTRAIACYL